jgi:hypothetical protein
MQQAGGECIRGDSIAGITRMPLKIYLSQSIAFLLATQILIQVLMQDILL